MTMATHPNQQTPAPGLRAYSVRDRITGQTSTMHLLPDLVLGLRALDYVVTPLDPATPPVEHPGRINAFIVTRGSGGARRYPVAVGIRTIITLSGGDFDELLTETLRDNSPFDVMVFSVEHDAETLWTQLLSERCGLKPYRVYRDNHGPERTTTEFPAIWPDRVTAIAWARDHPDVARIETMAREPVYVRPAPATTEGGC
jgi:hypothetical protein